MWVGIIALAGVDAEIGIVMLLYLDAAYERRKAAGRMNNLTDLQDTVIEGAVQRIRPEVMTVLAVLVGLLPIMWTRASRCWSAVRGRLQRQVCPAKAG